MRIKKLLLPSLFIVCLSSFNHATHFTGALDGTWVPVQEEMGGSKLPAAVFSSQQLVIADNRYTVTAESVDKGELKYANGKMDIYGKEGVNAGHHLTAIYKLENGELTICYNLKGDRYPDAFETKPQTMLFLSVFKRTY